ncbi:MAG: hypothetical protein OXE86_09070 [Alphaproteobacteria bacterium]|nr:hypothetical protein [Alphaproteobacteria bacterium]
MTNLFAMPDPGVGAHAVESGSARSAYPHATAWKPAFVRARVRARRRLLLPLSCPTVRGALAVAGADDEQPGG